jgi:DNA-directed RNA polymerase specialized sigma24 family protein
LRSEPSSRFTYDFVALDRDDHPTLSGQRNRGGTVGRLDRFSAAVLGRKPPREPLARNAADVKTGGSMPKQMVRHAPYLRRYARALTGSQREGDDLVRTAMERMLDGSVRLDEAIPLRTALYKALHQVWDSAQSGSAGASRADQRLQIMSPDRRAALLLVGVEGFLPSEAALVLDVSEEELDRRFSGAEADIDQQLTTDVLIIEDEPIIALDLTRVVRELGHNVAGAAATRDEAVELARRSAPGLVLADIRLADGSSGIDAATQILREFDVPVIFITAFPEHLLTGERPEPAFLITKPFREEAVKAIIAQALFFHNPREARQIA